MSSVWDYEAASIRPAESGRRARWLLLLLLGRGFCLPWLENWDRGTEFSFLLFDKEEERSERSWPQHGTTSRPMATITRSKASTQLPSPCGNRYPPAGPLTTALWACKIKLSFDPRKKWYGVWIPLISDVWTLIKIIRYRLIIKLFT